MVKSCLIDINFIYMRVKCLSFHDKKTGWSVRDIDFMRLTLLVGASGVGKTKILRSLLTLVNISKGRSENGAEWSLSFEIGTDSYIWRGAFSVQDDESLDFLRPNELSIPIEYEYLTKNGEVIIDRTSDYLQFNGQQTVKLEADKSAISLLKEEDVISPVFQAINKIYMPRTENAGGIRITPILSDNDAPIHDLKSIKRLHFLDPIDKLFLLYKNKLSEFDIIKQKFIEIFPLVTDVDFTIGNSFNKMSYPILRIHEVNVEKWIVQTDMSSGMYRTLSQLVTMVLAEDGDVILIDEFENSLGVNCIEEVAELVLYPDVDIQFILTSHHPYIINNIDFNKWKIVVRDGSTVSVHSAEDLKIGSHSKHDAFMQLIQTSAYKTGKA